MKDWAAWALQALYTPPKYPAKDADRLALLRICGNGEPPSPRLRKLWPKGQPK